jgi:hypothetical protein
LIIYLAPKYKTQVENQNKKYEIINFASEIVDSKMFYDSIHINESGRRQVSEKIAKTLIMK